MIPEEDLPLLQAAGFAKVFTMGTDTRDIVAYLRAWWGERGASRSSST